MTRAYQGFLLASTDLAGWPGYPDSGRGLLAE